MFIKQGDSVLVPVAVSVGGAEVADEALELAEFYIGGLRKLWPGEVERDDDGRFLVPLSQEETFAFRENSAIKLDVRLKFADGSVAGIKTPAYITVYDAVSEEVL